MLPYPTDRPLQKVSSYRSVSPNSGEPLLSGTFRKPPLSRCPLRTVQVDSCALIRCCLGAFFGFPHLLHRMVFAADFALRNANDGARQSGRQSTSARRSASRLITSSCAGVGSRSTPWPISSRCCSGRRPSRRPTWQRYTLLRDPGRWQRIRNGA